jgi:SAM-dependent methyltransferase
MMSDMSPIPSYDAFNRVYDTVISSDEFFEGQDYYRHFKDRYWNTLKYIGECLGPSQSRLLDVGSGQFAVLAKHLFGVQAEVVDIDTRHTRVLSENAIPFRKADLSRDELDPELSYDVVVLAEVIEHVPKPPYLVFEAIHRALSPGGFLIVTTPNLYRLRNLVRMATGRRIFDYFVVPEQDGPLGHFLEYSQDQIEWHVRRAGFQLHRSELSQLSLGGATPFARIARRSLAPVFAVRPLWRDSIVVIGHKPGTQAS